MTFKLNNKDYNAKKLDYNAVCDLYDLGTDISTLSNGINFSSIRNFIAVLIFNNDTELAGKEINDHIVNGGKLEDIVEIITKSVEDSGFFQALGKSTEAQA